MSQNLVVRGFVGTDEKAVVELWQACDLTRPWKDPRRDVARKLKVQRELFLVGFVDDALVASAMGGYDGQRGWVNYLAVHPKHQRTGTGIQLMEALEQGLLELGCPKVNLQVRSSNENVRLFYQAIGYVQEDVVSYGKRLITDPPATRALIYRHIA